MSFKFNFNVLGVSTIDGNADCDTDTHAGHDAVAAPACIEVSAPASSLTCGALEDLSVSPSLRLRKMTLSSDVAAVLGQNNGLQHNDLIAGEYEGGFKVWEGGIDLAGHLAQKWNVCTKAKSQPDSQDAVPDCYERPGPSQADSQQGAPPGARGPLKGRRVLELGCGAGLPGIVALLAGATVCFQDYNAPVLQHVTMANVAANEPSDARPKSPAQSTSAAAIADAAQHTATTPLQEPSDLQHASQYVAGPWASFPQWLSSQGATATFHVVLSAETIYEQQSVPQLLKCITQALHPTQGVCYIAAKTYYFGVGGGTALFRTVAEAQGLRVWSEAIIDDGKSNKREILGVAFTPSTVHQSI